MLGHWIEEWGLVGAGHWNGVWLVWGHWNMEWVRSILGVGGVDIGSVE